jgi:dedicated sortase system histidine kinase
VAKLSPHTRPFHQGLRFKLGLVSLTLLAIPWAGYRYLAETETFLRQAQEETLLARAEMIAGLIAEPAKPLLERHDDQTGHTLSNTLYAHPMSQPLQLDGYADEWASLLDQSRSFRASETVPNALAFDLLLGSQGEWLNLLIQVRDKTRRYAAADSDPASGDHLRLALPGGSGKPRQILIGTPAPGWVMARDRGDGSPIPEIRGEWQETGEGYDVELRLPLAMTGPERTLSLAVIDLQAGGPNRIAATSGLEKQENLARILIPSGRINQLLAQAGKRGIRSRLLNSQRRVIGQQGRLEAPSGMTKQGFLERLLNLILPLTQGGVSDKRERLGELDGPEIRQALAGAPALYRYQDQGRGLGMLSAAYPVQDGERINGVIVVEQSSHAILLLQQQALARLLEISLILFLLTGLSLLAFSSRLTGRITRLSKRIERSVSGEGRIKHALTPNRETDEIGDLARSFTAVMTRLQDYNHYLEAMSARLAHELRTPLTVVKSSLENLAQVDTGEEQQRYLQRADQGVERLSLILERMREASRLEQTLQGAELEPVDLAALTATLCETYRGIYPETGFECHPPHQPLTILAAPELIIQALDKLVGNALDFHNSGTPIVIAVKSLDSEQISLSVYNQGPPLPAGMQDQLFNSMVSVRNSRDDNPHLGLGLYLVRLIAEFHQGKATVENHEQGVRFTLSLPYRVIP